MIKDMFSIGIGSILTSSFAGVVGGATHIGHGIRSATQSMMGIGLLGHTAGKVKDWFK